MGHEIIWFARFEGLKVVLRTITFINPASLLTYPTVRAVWFYARGTYALGVFYEKLTGGRTQIFPFSIVPNYMRLLSSGFNSP